MGILRRASDGTGIAYVAVRSAEPSLSLRRSTASCAQTPFPCHPEAKRWVASAQFLRNCLLWISRRSPEQLRRRRSRWAPEHIRQVQRTIGERPLKRFFVYILSNASRTLSIGFTNGLERRIHEHRAKEADGFTRRYNITLLMHAEDSRRSETRSPGRSNSRDGVGRRSSPSSRSTIRAGTI